MAPKVSPGTCWQPGSGALSSAAVAALSLVWTKQRPNGWVVNIPGQAGSPRTQQAG